MAVFRFICSLFWVLSYLSFVDALESWDTDMYMLESMDEVGNINIDINSKMRTLQKSLTFEEVVSDFMGDLAMYSILQELSKRSLSSFGWYKNFLFPKHWISTQQMLIRPFNKNVDNVDKVDMDALGVEDEQFEAVFVYKRPLFPYQDVLLYKSGAPRELAWTAFSDKHMRQLAAIALVDLLVINTDRFAWPYCEQEPGYDYLSGVNSGNVMWHQVSIRGKSKRELDLLPIDNGYGFIYVWREKGLPQLAQRRIPQYFQDLDKYIATFWKMNAYLFNTMPNFKNVLTAHQRQVFKKVWLSKGDYIADTVLDITKHHRAADIARTMSDKAGDTEYKLFEHQEMSEFVDSDVNYYHLHTVQQMQAEVTENVALFRHHLLRYQELLKPPHGSNKKINNVKHRKSVHSAHKRNDNRLERLIRLLHDREADESTASKSIG